MPDSDLSVMVGGVVDGHFLSVNSYCPFEPRHLCTELPKAAQENEVNRAKTNRVGAQRIFLVFKRFPFLEQFVLLAILPFGVGNYFFAPAILFWEFRREPFTVHAVKCTCCGLAIGADFIGTRHLVSMGRAVASPH
jgi:hypothetical protein